MSTAWTRRFLRWIRSPRRRPIRRAPALRPRMERLESRETPAVFFGGVRIASADVTGDSVADIITAAGPGGAPHVRVMSGATGKDSLNFLAYDTSFGGGVFVAAGDVTGDGLADIVTGAGEGGSPQVKVFDGRSGQMISSFFAFPQAFTGGVRVAVGDVNGDGKGDIICAAGAGGLPVVSVYTSTGTLESSFNAYDPAFAGGVFVGAGDINGDGRAEIITGAGSGGAPHVKIFNNSGQLQNSFFAFDVGFTGGVTVAAGHYSSTAHDDIIVGAGFGGYPVVRIFDGSTLHSNKDFLAYDQKFGGGVFVAAPHFGNSSTDDILTGAGSSGGPHVRGFDGKSLTEVTGFMAYDPFGGSNTPFAHAGDNNNSDTTPPTITITTPQPTNPVTTNQTIHGTIVDDRAGLLTVTAQVDGGPAQTLTVTNGAFSFTTSLALSGSADGSHTVTFHGNDAANNQAAAQAFTFTLQSTQSQVTLDLAPENDGAVTGNHRTNDASVALVGTAPANSTVTLANTSFTTTADATGHFRFNAVSLALGVNSFTASATPSGGGTPLTFTRQIIRNSAPEVDGAVAPFHVDAGAQATIMNMPSIFSDADVSTLIHFDTNLGGFDVELFNQQTPQTVANFISYITAGAYTNSIFHRTVSNFVIQGGGFDFHTNPNRLDSVTTNPAVQNEPGISNQLGTIAMAKLGGNENSATSQFFFNLTDNSRGQPQLDTQNGGFTAFGRVLGDGMTIVNALAAIPTQNRGGVFTDIPLQNYPTPPAGNFPTDTTPANYAFINAVSVARLHDANNTDSLTYSIVSNSNPNLVTASLSGAKVTLNYAAGQSGRATITLRAVDSEGSAVDSTFTVNVGTVTDDSTAPTVTITDPPQNQTTTQNVTIHGTATDAGSGLFSLTASVDGHAAVPVTVATDGSFSFTTTLATDGSQNGAHTVAFVARDAAGNASAPVNFQFTLDTGVAQLSLDLDAASDTANGGVAGNHRTTLDSVTLTGVTDPGATVSLTGTNFTATADAQGAFSFANVPLAPGVNTFAAHAVDTSGSHRDFTRIVVRDTDPTVASSVQTFQVDASAAPTFLNLPTIFSDADVNSLVRFTTAAGTFDVELFDQQTPLTVANFLNYISSGRYQNSIFHRSIHDFILQGGGFDFLAGTPSHLNAITTDPAVTNEPGISNLLGTISMAKIDGQENSATSQFFFNLSDNSRGTAALDTQNGGFTAFGQLRGNGLAVIQALGSIATQNRGGDFTDIPLENYPQPPNGSFPDDTTAANFALISDVSIIRRTSADNADGLTFSIVSNSNPNLVTPAIVGGKLTLTYTAGQNGRARITIRATDTEGRSVDTTFSVTVGTVAPDTAPPTIAITDPTNNSTLTHNVTVHGKVVDDDTGVQSLTASTDGGPAVNVPVGNDGNFSFLSQFLFDGAHDGPHKVSFIAHDFAGNASLTQELNVTVHTAAGNLAFVDLDAASDTAGGGVAGNHRTILSSVTIVGTVAPNASVSLLGAGRSTTADAQGHYSFANVRLEIGVNVISVQSTTGTTTTEFDRLIMRDVDPTVASAIQDFRVQIGSGPSVFNLPAIFSDANTSSLVEFSTSAGTFDMEMFDQFAPNSVRDFLNYVSSGRYNSTIFHSATAGSTLQGGGFQYIYNPNGANHLDPIATNPAVATEPGLAVLPGTLTSVPRPVGLPDQTATTPGRFEFNIGGTNLTGGINPAAVSGPTVLGQLRGNGLQTVTNLAATPTQNRGGEFNEIPLKNYPQPPNGNFPADTKPLNYAFLNSATVLRQVDQRDGDALTYSVTGNSNSGLVTASIVNGKLTLSYAPGMSGNATITLRATDAEGRFVETSFKVTVGVIAIP